jgi:MFS family permease
MRHVALHGSTTPFTARPWYRWVVVGMGFLAVFGAIGFGRFGYSAVLPAMQKALNISSASAGALASWNLGGYMLMAAIGGMLASRFGPRLVVGIGSLVAAGGMLLTGFADGVVTAAAARLITGLGGGMVLVPSVALMSAWFDVGRRGLTSGLVSSGSSLALVLTGPIVPRIIDSGGADGWRSAWYFFAALTCAVGVLTFVVQRNRPRKVGPAVPDSIWTTDPMAARPKQGTIAATQAVLDRWSTVSGVTKPSTGATMRSVLRSRYAWHMGLVYFAFGFAYMIYFTFFQKRLITDVGLSSASAGNLFLVLGFCSIFCGVIWGGISDRIGRGRAIALNCLFQGVAAALFALWPTTPGLVLSAVIFGLTAIAIPGVVGAGCGDQFGPVLASASLGFVTIFLGVAQVLGPYLAGRMADAFGSLKWSYILATGVFVFGALLSGFLKESGWAAATRSGRRNKSSEEAAA